jgi:predicted ATPase
VGSRFEALHTTGLGPLLGREEELELLLRRWFQAKQGEGQVLLLSGEAGIGKSRLTAALLERLSVEPHARLRYFCSPQRTDSAFHPIIGQLERAAGIAHHDSPLVRLDKLDALLAQTATPPRDAALLAEMLSIPNDGRYPAQELSPLQRRQGTLEALVSQLAGLARQDPVLMIFEDVHWIDPTSLELLGRTVGQVSNLPVLLVVTFRPEFAPPWAGRSHLTSLALTRLDERDAAGIISRVVGDRALPADVLAEIVERSDGIPLFVEEITKAVLEAESEGGARRTLAAVPSLALAVPPSLHASLMARLDRLGPAKEIAQIGSAIGRHFSHALLALVARMSASELGAALDRLVQAGLLFREGAPPHASYLFNHALVQDAAYGTLLRENRRALHARIAETLESRFTETAESRPEILARHCSEAGLIEKAAGLWGKAGQQSMARSALVEAVAQFTRALKQIASLPGTPALRREQIKLQVTLITPLIHVKGYAAAETKAAAEQAHLLIDRAEALGEHPEDPLLLFQVLHAFWVASYVAFDGDAMRDLAGQFLALAQKRGATVPLMIGHRHMGLSLMMTGDMAESRPHLDQAVALYDPAEHRALATRFSQDTGVTARFYRSWILWLLGHPEAALRDTEKALRDAREIDQAATLMFALGHAAVVHILRGNYAATAEQAREHAALAEAKDARFWRALAMMNQGCALALTGQAVDATELLISGIAAFRATGAKAWIPFYLLHLARTHAVLGRFEEAWRCIDEATSAANITKETWCAAEIHRTAGEISLVSPTADAANARAHFERALAISREQNAKSWELRAATSLARLWADQGERQRARDLLAPVYGWFIEGFDTLDLKRAKTLFEELGNPP